VKTKNEGDAQAWAMGKLPRHVAIEGVIGVGKTTLAHALAARLEGRTLLETPGNNPFLERFYNDQPAWALPTQLSFLLQRTRQARELVQPGLFARTTVTDFMVEKDRLFAELTLSGDELNLYTQVYTEIMSGLPVPDLVIFLHADLSQLRSRIERRAIGYEQAIEDDYLARLGQLYARFFAEYDAAPLVVVDTASLNFADDNDAVEQLLACALGLAGGRRYLDSRGWDSGRAVF
jgi:deoxyadenosine/deoxycytidine kinase